jgi:hypothetical protein
VALSGLEAGMQAEGELVVDKTTGAKMFAAWSRGADWKEKTVIPAGAWTEGEVERLIAGLSSPEEYVRAIYPSLGEGPNGEERPNRPAQKQSEGMSARLRRICSGLMPGRHKRRS